MTSPDFANWLKQVPAGAPGDDKNITVSLEITMQASDWMALALGASRNGWRLEEAAAMLLVDGGPGLCEWMNQGTPRGKR